MHPKTYRKIAPPTLEGTKLHTLDGKEYGTLSEKAHRAHSELRNVVKLLLRQYEVLATLDDTFTKFQRTGTMDADDCLLPDYAVPRLKDLVNQSDGDRSQISKIVADSAKAPEDFATELLALRRFRSDMIKKYETVAKVQNHEGQGGPGREEDAREAL